MSLLAKLVAWIVGEFLAIGLILFLLAGTLCWLAGWIFVILLLAFSLTLVTWLYHRSPDLLEERLYAFGRTRDVWDKVFIIGLGVWFVAWLAVIPLDTVRFAWSHMPLGLQLTGLVVLLVACWLYCLVFRENPYLSAAVRVQQERGQQVISTGPYRYIRHPMYTASVMFYIGASLLMGSWAGVLADMILAGVLMIRAAREERLLCRDLPGYAEYMQLVRYRFVPGVW